MKTLIIFRKNIRQLLLPVHYTHLNRFKAKPLSRREIFSLLGHGLSALMILFLMAACTREEAAVPDDAGRAVHALTLRSLSYSGDRLVFADFAEFKDYFLELDSLFELDQDLFDSIVIATTPVTTIHEEYSTVDGFETFLSDPIMRAVLNLDYEVEIDGALVTYMTDGQILVSDVSNNTVRSAIRGLTKGEAVDLGDLPSGAFWAEPKDLEDAIKIGCGCRIYIEQSGCTEIRVYGRCNNLFGGKGEGNLTVTFDPDGSNGPVTVLDEDIDGNFEFFIDVSSCPLFPLYQDPGGFTATVDPECLLAITQSVKFLFDPDGLAACDEKHRSMEEFITSGTERMRVTTSYYENLLAYYHRAEIRSESWNGSSWTNIKADLWVEVDANRKGLDCALLDSKDDDKSCNNCKSLKVRVSWLSPCFHCDGDLIGRFRKIRSGITLSRTQEVDFVCCE